MNLKSIGCMGVLAGACLAAHAADRLPTIAPSAYDKEQVKAAEDFVAARKTPVFGPFEPLMHSPQMMTQARAMGDYLRYGSSIGTTLSELVILVTPHLVDAMDCKQAPKRLPGRETRSPAATKYREIWPLAVA